MDIEVGGETFHKEPNLLEQIAYRDTWGRGADSFIAMIYERLILMRDLMAENVFEKGGAAHSSAAAIAASDRSPAIHRRDLVESERLVASRRSILWPTPTPR